MKTQHAATPSSMPPSEERTTREPRARSITIVTDTWRPEINGVVTVLAALVQEIEAQGCTVHIVDPSRFFSLPLPWHPDLSFSLFPSRGVRRELLRHTTDAVHIATEGPLGFAARRICMQEKIPFTTFFHTNFQLYIGTYFGKWLVPLAYAILRRFHNAAAKTLVATESMRAELTAHGFERVEVCAFGVDTELFSHQAQISEPELKHPVFAFVGRLADEKSPEDFLRLDLPGTKLIIGDGYLRKELQRKYPEATFVGNKRREELAGWLSRADVVVFPSRTETFGLVVLESLSCGVPVAAHDVMGPREIITSGVDGYLGEDLREGALACLSLSREKCREKALTYSWKHSTETFLGAVTIPRT